MDIRDVHSWNVNPDQTLQETRRPALDVPEVRTERVEGVRSKLADGTFSVDAERIARSLLEQGIVRF